MTKTYKEYAEAVFALGLENDAVDEYSRSLETVREVLLQNAEYVDFLACYAVPATERAEAVAEAFSDSLPKNVCSFLQLLCEQGNIKQFFDIADEYARLLTAHRSMSNAVVYSVVELSQAQKSALTARLEKLCKKTLSVSYVIDKSIMGGILVDIDGSIIDGSIRHRLHEIKEVIDK